MTEMGCKKRIVKYTRHAWKILGPVLAPHVAALVQLVDNVGDEVTGIDTNHDRRDVVIKSTLAKAKEIGHDAFDDAKAVTVGELEGAVRSAIENALHHVREGVTWEEISDESDIDDEDR